MYKVFKVFKNPHALPEYLGQNESFKIARDKIALQELETGYRVYICEDQSELKEIWTRG